MPTPYRNQGALPKEFLSFDDAIKLIQSDTRKDPKVDIQFIVRNFTYINPGHTFTLKLLKRDTSGKIVPNGVRYVILANQYEATTFEHTVAEKYKELTKQELKGGPVRKMSTMVGDADGATANGTALISDNTDAIGREI